MGINILGGTMKYRWIILIAVCSLAVFILFYLFRLQQIGFDEVNSVKKLKESDSLVHIVKSKDDEILHYHGIDVPNMDWKKNNLILTEGWRLKRISFVNFSPFSRVKERLVTVKLDQKRKYDRVYVYKIKKIDIFLDEKFSNGGIFLE